MPRARRRRPAAPETGASSTSTSTSGPHRRVRCPLCAWKHDGGRHWQCDGCFTIFDTFDTRAHCPKCDKTWRLTWCPRCHDPSPHEDWYVEEPGAP